MGYYGQIVKLVPVTPAGIDRQVQFNNNGVMAGNSGLIFRIATNSLEVGGPVKATAQLTTLQKTQPPDTDLVNGELAIWYDEPNQKIKFKAKSSTGVIVRGNVALA